MTVHDGVFILEHLKRMNHMDTAGFNVSAAITSILPMNQVVYTGDDDGRVVCFLIAIYLRFTANKSASMNGIVSSVVGVRDVRRISLGLQAGHLEFSSYLWPHL